MKKNIGLLTAIAIGDSFGRAFEFATKDKIEESLDMSVYSPGMGKYPDGKVKYVQNYINILIDNFKVIEKGSLKDSIARQNASFLIKDNIKHEDKILE